MKAIFKTRYTSEERLLITNSLSHPGNHFKIIKVEMPDILSQFLDGNPMREFQYETGLYTKHLNLHVLPLLGLVQGKTASLTDEDTYALFLGETNQVLAINVGENQPDQYMLLDYSQFEKLKAEVERINFWVAITNQTTWPLVKFNLYEGYDKQLNRSVFAGFRVNHGLSAIGRYYYSSIELLKTEKELFDNGVFQNFIRRTVLEIEKNLAISA